MAQGASLSRCRSEANRLWRVSAHFGGGDSLAGSPAGFAGGVARLSPVAWWAARRSAPRAHRPARRTERPWRAGANPSVNSSIFWMTTGCMRRFLLERTHRAGGRDADAIDHFHAFDDAAEHRVTPARGQGIEIGVVGDVDVDLAIARVRAAGAREAHGAAQILEAVAGFVRDRLRRGHGLVVEADAAALDHEVRDHAMEQRVACSRPRAHSPGNFPRSAARDPAAFR